MHDKLQRLSGMRHVSHAKGSPFDHKCCETSHSKEAREAAQEAYEMREAGERSVRMPKRH